jgi:catechol 2,3-dioxygenase-like lactoylglutathione lyase family enzyme
MSAVGRLVYAVFESPDVEAAVAYHADVLGLAVVRAEADGAELSAGLDHHAVAIRRGNDARIAGIGLELEAGQELGTVAKALTGAGVAVERRSDALPGVAELLEVTDPEGNTLHLFESIARGVAHAPQSGVAPRKLGHICLRTTDATSLTAWYEEHLGFAWSDWIGDFFSFVRTGRGTDHHTLNFLNGTASGNVLHHIAYELRDVTHVQEACDVLWATGHPLVWGPGRHGPGHNIFTYHHGPDGHLVELFTQLDVVVPGAEPAFEPRPWHEDAPQVPKVWVPDPLTPNRWGIAPPPDFM